MRKYIGECTTWPARFMYNLQIELHTPWHLRLLAVVRHGQRVSFIIYSLNDTCFGIYDSLPFPHCSAVAVDYCCVVQMCITSGRVGSLVSARALFKQIRWLVRLVLLLSLVSCIFVSVCLPHVAFGRVYILILSSLLRFSWYFA